jgi:GNAT superfamily N-acetyltransferase
MDRAISPAEPGSIDFDEFMAVAAEGAILLAGLGHPCTRHLLARVGAEPAGIVALEPVGDAALLRSLYVRERWRASGLGKALVDDAFARAMRENTGAIYLFSYRTGAFFERHGWKPIAVEEAAACLRGAPQVAHYDACGWLADEKAFVKRP